MMPLISKLRSLTKKEENKELLIHSLLSITVRIVGAGAAFLMNVFVARYLGATEAGYFFLAVIITTLLATIGRIGADQTILRFVSIYSEEGEWIKVHALMKKIMLWTFLPILGLALLTCVFSKQISIYFFHKPELQWPLFWTSISMPFFAGYNIHGMALQGRKKVLLSVTSLKILTPFFLILFVVAFSPSNAYAASGYYTLACMLNLLTGYYWWYKNVPRGLGKADFDSSVLWKSCWPLWISTIMQQVTLWGGQLIAGIFTSSEDLAQLAVARNTATLVAFILMAVNNVSSPRFAAMYSQGKMEQLKNYARNTTWLMTLVALPITLVIWFFPTYIMALFGKDFAGGAWLLRILALGQFVSVITGTVASLLIMSGHEKDLKNLRIINAIVAIVLALILTPIFGAIGSAISSAVAMASFNFMAVGLVKKRLGFNTMSVFGFK
jgi:O-antigen/teichoic acid export membrane protein